MRYYENLQKTSENRLKGRSYYIPTGDAEYTLLNGKWRFHLEKDGDLFTANEPVNKWSSITVPSTWQEAGVQSHNYTNIAYPIPVDPPYVPMENPVGIYEKDFSVDDTAFRTYIVFEGVGPCADVLVNGERVGFTQGSHLQAEFDLTDFVKKGKNTLRVLVRKWCCGTYLEDQDFLRCQGIFRDVYLLTRPQGHIVDIDIHTENNDTVIIKTAPSVDVSLFDGEKQLCTTKTDEGGYAEIKVENPTLWNAEKPYLYTLEFKKAGEVILQNVGFRTISVSDKNEILINGVPVKFKGVNRHDVGFDGNWTASDEEMLKDLKVMKELNVNTIRTSHYPPHPRFLDYCDEMGFYVMLETDLETHGFMGVVPSKVMQNNPGAYAFNVEDGGWPCTQPEFEKEFLERMVRAYHRDKNHTSIFSWSVGNESGYAANQIKAIDWLRETDKFRLTHAEDASRAIMRWSKDVEKREKALKTARLLGEDTESAQKKYDLAVSFLEKAVEEHEKVDLFSRMYDTFDKMIWQAEDNPLVRKPIFHCEVAHGMGDGPGSVWRYTELMYKYPNITGFCLWEWVDLCIVDGGVKKYGGDFPEELVDNGCGCCDGYVFSDRSYKPYSYELKAAFAPLRFELNGAKVTVENRFDFSDLNEYTLKYTVSCDGEALEQKELTLNCPPKQLASFNIEKEPPKECKYGAYITVELLNKDSYSVVKLQKKLKTKLLPIINKANPVSLKENGRLIIAEGKNFTYMFDKYAGNLKSAVVNGRELLAEPVRFSAFRAYRECEVRHSLESKWAALHLINEFTRVYDTKIEGNKIIFNSALSGPANTPTVKYNLCLEIYDNGTVCFDINGDVKESVYWLYRLGFNFTLLKKNCRFKYFGMGPAQNDCDCNHGTTVDWYESSANEQYVDFAVPQEHGNHTNTRELIVEDTLCFKGNDEFCCNVSSFGAKQLFNANHSDEIGESFATHIRIDYKNSGLSAPRDAANAPEEYCIKEKHFHFKFSMELKENNGL